MNERQRMLSARFDVPDGKTDFCSNDYLGIIHHGLIEKKLAGDAGSTPAWVRWIPFTGR